MTRRLRVRPVTVQILASALVASLAPVPAAHAAGGQQYPETPYREQLPIDENRDWSDQIPAHVSVVDGTAELERDGQRETAEQNVPLLAGDRLRTARGRVEVLFSDGSALALDQDTDVDLLSDSLLRLQAGRIRLAIARGAAELAYRVDAAGTTTWIRSAGEYRIVIDNRSAEPDVLVTVLRGAAELESAGGRTLVRTGFEARANARNEPSLPYAANVAVWDTFDRWVEDQHRYRTGARSAQYLPTELRHYGGAFDHDGSWEHEQGYGYVWYPAVAVDWRPYYNGGWSFYGSFGWTWVGGGRWTWPTHHYGRWGLRTGRWFWIPGRTWGPAWVSWASAPGYLGWCPLGFDNRPVTSVTNINYYGGDRRYGWTVLPSNRFGSRVAVNRWAVSPQTLSEGRFTLHTGSPVRPSVAARQIEPLRAPTGSGSGGRYAVPRLGGSSPSASIATSPSGVGDETRSSVARSRVAPTPGRPSNPVTRPSGPDENPSDSPSTVSAGPRSRSAPSASPGDDGGAADRPATVRTAAPRSRSNPSQGPAPAAGPSGGSSSGQSSGHAVGGRRSMSSVPAPLPTERPTISRRMAASPYESAPAQRAFGFSQGAPSNVEGRSMPSREIGRPRASAPSYERAPRIQRSGPTWPRQAEPSAPSRSVRTAPMQSPRVERSAPSGSDRVGRSSPSSTPSAESRGQARSRNGR